jgi:hypothetical protein
LHILCTANALKQAPLLLARVLAVVLVENVFAAHVLNNAFE